jgi:hypothetical protein
MIKFKIIVATTATSYSETFQKKKQLNTGNSELLTAILD